MKYVVYLHITSWRGVSIGAEHYYGNFQIDNRHTDYMTHKDKRITYVISTEEAKALNKKDNQNFFKSSFKWKKGDESDRFDTKEQLREVALKQFLEAYGEESILVDGSTIYSDFADATLHSPEKYIKLMANARDSHKEKDYRAAYEAMKADGFHFE